jgi:PAS domain S-box-containing protein
VADDDPVFRALFAAYPDALVVSDANGTIVLANPAAAALLGYAEGELVGLGVDVLVPDAIRPRHAAYREAYGRAPKARPMGTQMDLVAKRKDGSEVLVEIALSPLQGKQSRLVVAAIRDIGAYPRVKQALQRARYSEHLAQLGRLAVDARDPQVVLGHVPEIATRALQLEVGVVWLVDAAGSTCRLASGVGLVPGEALGTRVANTPETPPGFVLAEGRAIVVPDYRAERRFTVPPHYLDAALVSGLAVPLADRGRLIGVLAVRSREGRSFGDEEVRFVESLSNLLATSLQRSRSEEALGHAQRLESVGQLTGGIAHDFNNLLTVIQGNLQVLDELPALADEPAARQLVAAATRASRRGAELTGKLLAFARRQVLQPSAVDVNALLLSLADLLRRTLDQHIRIEVDAPPCPPCRADAGQLESALLNIAINARDAMPGGGRLRFKAERCTALPPGVLGGLEGAERGGREGAGSAALERAEYGDGPRRAEHGDGPQRAEYGARGGPFIAISIADSGSGMSAEILERAFEPFFTTKEAGRGTGLGLSTVYGFVKQSKGGIAIDSAPGAGTTVTLYIPCADGAVEGIAAPDAADAVRPGLHVLLVEDDADVRAVIETFLNAMQCRVTACGNGEQALPVLDRDDTLDLLITDIALGAGMRGTQLAQRARARRPGLPVLLMSGFSAELIEAEREASPGRELLRKPCTRAELAQAIARVVKG